mgnify:CR=1 FL=1
MKKILITGSAGFIGFSLAKDLLKKGYKILGYDSLNKYYDVQLKLSRNNILKKFKNYTFVKGDIEDQKKLNKHVLKFKPSIIIHLAAQAGVRYSLEVPRKYISSNIVGTFNIIELAHKLKTKHLLIASSSSVYGSNKSKSFKETDKTDTQMSIYAATKKSTESIAHSYSSLWKLPITMLRFFTVYGPWGRPDMAMYIFANNIQNNKPITVYNNGEMKRDFTYIDDIINGTKAACLSDYKCEIFNLGNHKSEELMDMINIIEDSLGKKAIIEYEPIQSGDIIESFADIDKSIELLNYKPNTDIIKGIPQFIDWYKKYHKV